MQSDKNPSFVELFTSTKNLALLGILSAVSYILYVLLKFPLSFIFPSFLEMQFSDLPALLGGFALGPYAGATVIIVKCLLKMPLSTSMCVGEVADIIVGLAFVLPSSIYYGYCKTKKRAVISMMISTLCATAISVLANRFVLIPFYTELYFVGDIKNVASAMRGLYPDITEENLYAYYLPLAVLPFNILRCGICALITYFTYKPLSRALHWERNSKKTNVDTSSQESTDE